MPKVLAVSTNIVVELKCVEISGGSISNGIEWHSEIVDSNKNNKWSMFLSGFCCIDRGFFVCVYYAYETKLFFIQSNFSAGDEM